MQALVRFLNDSLFSHPHESRQVRKGDVVAVEMDRDNIWFTGFDGTVGHRAAGYKLICKVGDRIRLIAVDNFSRTWHNHMIIPRFTEVEISDFSWAMGQEHIAFFWNGDRCLVMLDEVDFVGEPSPNMCSCDINSLMAYGCRCGGV
jgi:hypothetical protein